MVAPIRGRKQQLVGQDPNIDDMEVFVLEVHFTMLATRPDGERVIVASRQLIDVAHRIDVRELPLQHKGANDEVVMPMHVVSASRATEDFVAERPQPPKPGASRLVGTEVEARMAGENCLGMPAD